MLRAGRGACVTARGGGQHAIGVGGGKNGKIRGAEVTAGREKRSKRLKRTFPFSYGALPKLVGHGACKGACCCLAQCGYAHGTAVHEMKAATKNARLHVTHRNSHKCAGNEVFTSPPASCPACCCSQGSAP